MSQFELLRSLAKNLNSDRRQAREGKTPNLAAIENCLDSLTEHFNCSICREQLKRPIQTQCGHVFCGGCLEDISKQPGATCPLCKKAISNRSLVIREDVGDMVEVLGKIAKAFATEVGNLFKDKENVGKSPKPEDMKKKTHKSRSRSKTPTSSKSSKEEDDESAAVEVVDLEVNDEKKTKRTPEAPGEDADVEIVPESDELVDKKEDEVITGGALNLEVQEKQPVTKAGNEAGLGSKLSKEALVDKMMNQKYSIIAVDVIAQPLDLSVPHKPRPTSAKYSYKSRTSAVRYVTPLDLSIKKEKRKLEEIEEVSLANQKQEKRGQEKEIGNERKKGKFEGKTPEKMKKSVTALKSAPAATATSEVSKKEKAKTPKKKKPILEESPIPKDPEIFTPSPVDLPPADDPPLFSQTPPPIIKPVEKRVPAPSKAVRNLNIEDTPMAHIRPKYTSTPIPGKLLEKKLSVRKQAGGENIKSGAPAASSSAKPTISTQMQRAGMTQNFLAQEILKDFDEMFDTSTPPPPCSGTDDILRTIPEETFNPPPKKLTQKRDNRQPIAAAAGGPVTSSDEIFTRIPDPSTSSKLKSQKNLAPISSSDEIFSKIPDESLDANKLKSQKKGGQAPAQEVSKGGFPFKQPKPGAAVTPSKQKKRVEAFMGEEDDEFQMPRDSDVLFLDISTPAGGNENAKKSVQPADMDLDLVENKKRRSSGGSEGEKENSNRKRRKSLSRSRTSSPVKASNNQFDPERNSIKIRGGKDIYEVLDAFEDEDDELFVKMPESSEKRNAGGVKEKEDCVVKKPTAAVVGKRKRYVFCSTRLNKLQMAKLQELCKLCDGVISKDFTPEVTHLIINLTNGRVMQTLKYLQAISNGLWVVTYDWVEMCINTGEMVDEEKYETSNYKNCDPGARRARLATKKVFDGFKFYFATDIYKMLGFTKDEVMTLLDRLGATVVNAAESRFKDLIIIGICNGNTTEYNDWLYTNKWVTVTFEWVIECVLEYRLKPFEKKHLCVDTDQVTSVNGPKDFQQAFTQYQTQKLNMSSSSY